MKLNDLNIGVANEAEVTVPKPRLVFCLPGNQFSGSFLDRWTETLNYFHNVGVQVFCSRAYSSVVQFARNSVLGGDVLRGKNQKPFDGKVDYTHLVWLDSDVLWKPEDIVKLIVRDVDIVAAPYLMSDNEHYTIVEEWDEEYFAKNGTFKFLTKESLKNAKNLIEAVYTGFGCIVIKRGVFESIQYPWFKQRIVNLTDEIADYSAEDVDFCLTAREKGYKINVDPTVRVAHEKQVALI